MKTHRTQRKKRRVDIIPDFAFASPILLIEVSVTLGIYWFPVIEDSVEEK